jgi:ABC-2 type transport system ATP-binding protein
VIVVEGLSKRFGDTQAVEDVSFRAEPGRVTGFLGHNGAGKTTTLRMILGLVAPDAGRAEVLGRPIAELEDPLRRVGVLLEDGVHPGRTGRDHLRVLAATAPVSRSRVDEVLEVVGLSDDADRRIGAYSQGMRRRLGIGAALLARPEVVILDEPTNGLDPDGVRWLRDVLRRLADDGATVLLSSHQLAEVAQTVDDVIVLDRGRLVEQTTLKEMLREAGSEVVVRSPGAEVLADRLEQAGVDAEAVSSEELHAHDVPAGVVSELAVASGLPVWEVRTRHATLEDAFFAVTERAREEEDEAGASDDDNNDANDNDTEDDDREPAEDAASANADLDAEELRHTQEALSEELRSRRSFAGPRVVAVLGTTPGAGATTTALLAGEVLASHLGVRVLAAALSADHRRLAQPALERSDLGLDELLRDLPGFDDVARISPYVSRLRSGLETLAGVADPERLAQVGPGEVDALLDFAGRFYELLIVDVGDLPASALRTALARADQVALVSPAVTEEGTVPAPPVLELLDELRDDPSTIVLNRVGAERARAFARGDGGPGHALLPEDRALARALDAEDFAIEDAEPSTRIAVTRLGLALTEGIR